MRSSGLSWTATVAILLSSAALIVSLTSLYLAQLKRADFRVLLLADSRARLTSSSWIQTDPAVPTDITVIAEALVVNLGARAGVLYPIVLMVTPSRIEQFHAAPTPQGNHPVVYGPREVNSFRVSIRLGDRATMPEEVTDSARGTRALKLLDTPIKLLVGWRFVRGYRLLPWKRGEPIERAGSVEFPVDASTLAQGFEANRRS